MTDSVFPADAYILVEGGLDFVYADPNPGVYGLGVVANALGNLCRFAGNCPEFYSVAEHSVLVGDYVARLASECCQTQKYVAEVRLAGLLHDAAEAFLVDIPRPVKRLLEDYKKMEDELFPKVFTRLTGLPYESYLSVSDLVKEADTAVLHAEMFVFFGRTFGPVDSKVVAGINCWSPTKAKGRFLEEVEKTLLEVKRCS